MILVHIKTRLDLLGIQTFRWDQRLGRQCSNLNRHVSTQEKLLSTVVLSSLLCITVVMLGYDWWLCMVINISAQQYSGGLLPDIILLTQVYYQWGTYMAVYL